MKDKKNKKQIKKKYTFKEELANGITHGVGVIFGIVSLIVLLNLSIKKESTISIIAFSIYGACFILMYLASTLYHSIPNERAKKILRVFDHSSIFLFIAGTYTPIALLTMGGNLRLGVLISIWSIAIGGVIFKILTFNKLDKYKVLSLSIYIGMGWIAVFTIKPIIQMTSISFFLWILGGGLLYSLGTVFYANKKIPYNHAIWHLFVLAASMAHFVGILIHLT